MPDNVTVSNGALSDYTVSSDDAGAAGQVQRVKLAYSADGSATHVAADADGLLVNLGANNDVSVTGTVAVAEAGLSGTVKSTVITVGTSAVALPASPLAGRRALLVQSDATNSAYIYLGGSAVTANAASTGGYILTSGQSLALDAAGATVYAIAGAAAQTVRIIEVS